MFLGELMTLFSRPYLDVDMPFFQLKMTFFYAFFYGSVYCHSTVAIAERITIFTKPIRGHHTFLHVEWEG